MLSHTAFAQKQTFSVIPKPSHPGVAAPPDVTVAKVATMDENQQEKVTFNRGDTILYVAWLKSSLSTATQVTLVFDVTTGSTSIVHEEYQTNIDPGTHGLYIQRTIPADATPGKYTFTATVTYKGQSDAKSSEFTVS